MNRFIRCLFFLLALVAGLMGAAAMLVLPGETSKTAPTGRSLRQSVTFQPRRRFGRETSMKTDLPSSSHSGLTSKTRRSRTLPTFAAELQGRLADGRAAVKVDPDLSREFSRQTLDEFKRNASSASIEGLDDIAEDRLKSNSEDFFSRIQSHLLDDPQSMSSNACWKPIFHNVQSLDDNQIEELNNMIATSFGGTTLVDPTNALINDRFIQKDNRYGERLAAKKELGRAKSRVFKRYREGESSRATSSARYGGELEPLETTSVDHALSRQTSASFASPATVIELGHGDMGRMLSIVTSLASDASLSSPLHLQKKAAVISQDLADEKDKESKRRRRPTRLPSLCRLGTCFGGQARRDHNGKD